jgi:hypothetical protein
MDALSPYQLVEGKLSSLIEGHHCCRGDKNLGQACHVEDALPSSAKVHADTADTCERRCQTEIRGYTSTMSLGVHKPLEAFSRNSCRR